MKLRQCGDRELWLVRGKDWCLPVHVTPCVQEAEPEAATEPVYYCHIVPAMVPTPSQCNALHAHFKKHTLDRAENKWIIVAADISKLCEKAAGITPGYYRTWPSTEQSPQQQQAMEEVPDEFEVAIKDKPAIGKDADEFLKFLFQQTGLARLDEFRLIWYQLQVCGADWIYKRQRTLDLGFVKLDAVPFRANWKQIFLARFPWISRWFRLPKADRDARLETERTAAFIRGSWMAELDPKEWNAQWSVEARSTKAWRDYIQSNELARLSKVSRHNYAIWWRSQITRMEHKLYDILGEFILATSAPCGAFSVRDSHGRAFLTPKVAQGRVQAEGEHNHASVVVSPDPTLEVESAGELGEVSFSVDALPDPVSVIRLPIEDMRDAGGNVAESGNG